MSDLHVGSLARGYEPVGRLAERFLAQDPDWAFQLVVHAGDETVVDLAAGRGYARAVHLQASASKGVSGIAVAVALQASGVHVSTPVSAVWPEFAAAGKAGVTIAELLSHQAGLLRSTRSFTAAEWGEGRTVAADLAAQQPCWAPGRAHGYHALTIGPLADELVHRLTGVQLWELYEAEVRAPGDLDFWVRMPPAQRERLVEVRVPATAAGEPTGSLTEQAVGQLDALGPGNTWINSSELIAAGVPSVSGVGSARGLAGAYACAIGVGGHPPLLSTEAVAAVAQLQVAGPDLVLGGETRYGVLFQKPGPRLDFGTAAAFGHDGAGGALGFADPQTRLAVGYVTGAVPVPAGADQRALAFARLLRQIRLTGRPPQ